MTDVARRPSLSDPSLYINRELSWLGFNNRVLEQARDERHPLLERLRFVAISETNLDEFFMIRVAGLQQQVASELPNPVPDGMTPEEQLLRIHDHTEEFFEERRRILNTELIPALEEEGIRMVPHDKVRAAERRELREKFVRDILPILTPLAIDPAHPFPHISNLSLNLLVVIEDAGRRVMARVKVPTTIDRFMRLAEEDHGPGERPEMRFVGVEEVISANLDELFPGKEVVASYVFQVTRNADFVIEEDEAADLLQAIEDELESRWFGQSVRLVVSDEMPDHLRDWLARNLKLDENSVFASPHPIGLADVAELTLYHAGHQERRHPALPPLRLVRARRRLRQGGGQRPRGARHKADPLPRRRELPYSRDALGGARRADAGRRPGRAEGALRRGAEHYLGAPARGQGRPRRLRYRRPQDARQDLPGRQARGFWPQTLRPPRHGELQPGDGPRLHGLLVLHRRPDARGGRLGPLQLPYRLLRAGGAPRAARRPSYHAREYSAPDRGADREGQGRRARQHHVQDQLAHGPPDHRAPLPSLPGRGEDRPDRPQHLLPQARRGGREREHPRGLAGRTLPRARPYLRLLRW